MRDGNLRFGCIILAAGASTRLGQPKQLLTIHGESLLRRAARIAVEAGSAATVVVLGSGAERMAQELDGLPVSAVYNDEWETGMASSVRSGVHALLALPAPPDAIAVLLCDQPALMPDTVRALVETVAETDASAALCRYDNGAEGPPCLFTSSLYTRLLGLEGQAGARQVIAQLPDNAVRRVSFPRGSHDIDAPEDWQRFQ